MLTINQMRTVKVPVKVLSMRWSSGALTEHSEASVFKCSACGSKLGARRFATAFIRKDSGAEHSMRLCEDCGVQAEADLEDLASCGWSAKLEGGPDIPVGSLCDGTFPNDIGDEGKDGVWVNPKLLELLLKGKIPHARVIERDGHKYLHCSG